MITQIRNFKYFSRKVFLLCVSLGFILYSCSKDESVGPEVDQNQNQLEETVYDPYLTEKLINEIGNDAKLLQEELQMDDEFYDVYASLLDFSLIPVILNPELDEDELSKLMENTNAQNTLKLYGMDEALYEKNLDEITNKTINFFDKMKNNGIDPVTLGMAIEDLSKSEKFQQKLETNREINGTFSAKNNSAAWCYSLCAAAVVPCVGIALGGYMRKMASCMNMAVNSPQRIQCMRGVVIEQSSVAVACLVGVAGCIYGCTREATTDNVLEAGRETQKIKDATISNVKKYTNVPVKDLQQNWSDSFYVGYEKAKEASN